MIKLILSSTPGDLYRAAMDCHVFCGYLLARGYDVDVAWTFRALLATRPWRYQSSGLVAPWRIVAAWQEPVARP